jgi:hypothetical protein
MAIAPETAIFKFEDGCLCSCFGLRAVFGVGVDLGDGTAVDFDGERGGEAVHVFGRVDVEGYEN